MRYVQDVPAGDTEAIEGTRAHMVAYLSAVASADDDPETNADDVAIWSSRHPTNSGLLRLIGILDAEPNAPYLREDFDPYAYVDHDLFAQEIAAAERNLEVLHGTA